MSYKQERIKPYGNNGSKGEQVRQMFDSIAHSYDLLNHTLSFGIDKHWRKAAIDSLRPYAPQRILDVATGTGDFAILAAKEDCLDLHLPDNTYDALMVAYGIRNFENLDRGLQEMCRVLKPGGRLVIIELTSPNSFPMKQLFHFYSHVFMPMLGKIISRDNKAYTYLPATMEAFPQGEEMQGILSKAGFTDVKFKRFTFGLSTLYTATK